MQPTSNATIYIQSFRYVPETYSHPQTCYKYLLSETEIKSVEPILFYTSHITKRLLKLKYSDTWRLVYVAVSVWYVLLWKNTALNWIHTRIIFGYTFPKIKHVKYLFCAQCNVLFTTFNLLDFHVCFLLYRCVRLFHSTPFSHQHKYSVWFTHNSSCRT